MPWLFKFKGKSKVWWLGYRLHGRQILRSTGFRKREDAEGELAKVNALLAAQKAKALTRELFEELTGQKLPHLTFTAALKDWMTEAAGTTAAGTLERYKAIGEDLGTFLKADDRGPLIEEVSRADVQRFLNQRRANVSAATANLMRKIVTVFFRRCKACGYIRESPVEGVPRFKASKGEARARRPYTVAEIQLLYSKAPEGFWKYMVLAGYLTGLRMGDLIICPWGGVDLDRAVIRLSTIKTGTPMTIPIAKPLLTMLAKLKRDAGAVSPGDFIWPEQAKQYLEKGSGEFSNEFHALVLTPAGLVSARLDKKGHKKGRAAKREISKVSFHSLRHSFVSFLKAAGASQSIAKALAGHSSDAISDLYTHTSEAEMASAVAKLPEVT